MRKMAEWVLLPLTLLGAAGIGWWTGHVLRSSQKTFDPETIPKRRPAARSPAPEARMSCERCRNKKG